MFVSLVGISLVLSAPVWIPVVFAAYAIGRKQYGLKLLFALVTVEAIALAAASWLILWLSATFTIPQQF